MFDYGQDDDGVFYFAMEYLNGATLQSIVARTGPLDASRATQILEQISSALVAAHGAGLIHRDLKPANIMAFLPHRHGAADEAIKVLDFGLVVPATEDLSKSDRIVGSPRYMSPETIIADAAIDARSDIYSLGCVAYFLLTGQPLFTDDDVYVVIERHLYEKPVPPSELGVDAPYLERLIMACLEKDPERRPDSARTLQRALRNSPLFGEFTSDDALRWWIENDRVLEDGTKDPDTTEHVAIRLGRSN